MMRFVMLAIACIALCSGQKMSELRPILNQYGVTSDRILHSREYQTTVKCSTLFNRTWAARDIENTIESKLGDRFRWVTDEYAAVYLVKKYDTHKKHISKLSNGSDYYNENDEKDIERRLDIKWSPVREYDHLDYVIPSPTIYNHTITKLEEDVHVCFTKRSCGTKVYDQKTPHTVQELYNMFPNMEKLLGSEVHPSDRLKSGGVTAGWISSRWGVLDGHYLVKSELGLKYGSSKRWAHTGDYKDSAHSGCMTGEWSARVFVDEYVEDKEIDFLDSAHALTTDEAIVAPLRAMHVAIDSSSYMKPHYCSEHIPQIYDVISIVMAVVGLCALGLLVVYEVVSRFYLRTRWLLVSDDAV